MRILLPFLLILLCKVVWAQQPISASSKRFGLYAGANSSNMNFNKGVPAPLNPINHAWKHGISLGFLVRVPIAGKLMLQPEYQFSQRNGKDKSSNTNYEFDYLSMPLLLRYAISNKISLLTGAHADLLIRAKSTSNETALTITKDVEERSIGAVIGLEAVIGHSLFINARYLHGFNHIGIGQRSSVKEFKYEGLQLTAGISF